MKFHKQESDLLDRNLRPGYLDSVIYEILCFARTGIFKRMLKELDAAVIPEAIIQIIVIYWNIRNAEF